MSEGYQLPEKWSEDAVDESGSKLSKRYACSAPGVALIFAGDRVDVRELNDVMLQRVEEA